MTDFSVSPSEMKRLTDISERDLEAMRSGDVPVGDPEMARLAEFVRELGDAFPEPSTVHLEAGHVAAMLEAARLATDKGESALQPTSNAHGPAGQASGLPKSWRERVAMKIGTAFATRTAKIALAAIAMVLAFSGVAVAGVLPAPVQKAVADGAAVVGVNLPGGSDEIEADDVQESPVDQIDKGQDAQDEVGGVEQDQNNQDQLEGADEDNQDELDGVDQNDQDEADSQDHSDSQKADQSDAGDQADEADDSDEIDAGDSGDQHNSDSHDSGDTTDEQSHDSESD